ncbi:MAG: nitrile hydratase subunit alpha [Rhodospirillales bacterium]
MSDERDTHGHAHGHDHPHDHNHPHEAIEADESANEFAVMAEAMKELLIEHGYITADDVRTALEYMDSRDPAMGARVVAKAWTDPTFKARLIDDAPSACKELGIDVSPAHLVVVENTPQIHNVIVCTLCSCYPRTLLGLPPDWYKSRAYRSRVVIEPRTVLKEFGTELPGNVTVRVHDSNADLRYIVLPMQPKGTEGWSEDRLAALVSRDAMVGVTLPHA